MPEEMQNVRLSTRAVKNLGWQEQLEYIIQKPHSMLIESNISLLRYDFVGCIENVTQLNKFKVAILEDENMIPYSNYMTKISHIT